jgi:hypothetical protein
MGVGLAFQFLCFEAFGPDGSCVKIDEYVSIKIKKKFVKKRDPSIEVRRVNRALRAPLWDVPIKRGRRFVGQRTRSFRVIRIFMARLSLTCVWLFVRNTWGDLEWRSICIELEVFVQGGRLHEKNFIPAWRNGPTITVKITRLFAEDANKFSLLLDLAYQTPQVEKMIARSTSQEVFGGAMVEIQEQSLIELKKGRFLPEWVRERLDKIVLTESDQAEEDSVESDQGQEAFVESDQSQADSVELVQGQESLAELDQAQEGPAESGQAQEVVKYLSSTQEVVEQLLALIHMDQDLCDYLAEKGPSLEDKMGHFIGLKSFSFSIVRTLLRFKFFMRMEPSALFLE